MFTESTWLSSKYLMLLQPSSCKRTLRSCRNTSWQGLRLAVESQHLRLGNSTQKQPVTIDMVFLKDGSSCPGSLTRNTVETGSLKTEPPPMKPWFCSWSSSRLWGHQHIGANIIWFLYITLIYIDLHWWYESPSQDCPGDFAPWCIGSRPGEDGLLGVDLLGGGGREVPGQEKRDVPRPHHVVRFEACHLPGPPSAGSEGRWVAGGNVQGGKDWCFCVFKGMNDDLQLGAFSRSTFIYWRVQSTHCIWQCGVHGKCCLWRCGIRYTLDLHMSAL